MKPLFKQPTFLLGILFIGIMLTSSFIHALFFGSVIPKTPYVYSSENVLDAAAPFAPLDHTILGTDMAGNHLLFYIIQGAKYTILGTFVIAFMSFSLALIIGTPMGFYQQKPWFKGVEQTISVLYFIPASLIAYNFLEPLLIEPFSGFQTTLAYRIFVEVLVIGLLLVPPAAILIANEVSELLKKEFIQSSRVLGGRKWHLFSRHLLPHLRGRFIQLVSIQSIQALLILTHLGVFEMFFGGTDRSFGLGAEPPTPLTYDWASIVGMYYDTIMTNLSWLLIAPMTFLVLFVMSIIGISYGIQKHLQSTRRNKTIPFRSQSEEASKGEKEFEFIERSAK